MLVAEHGAQALTIDALAKAAGVTKGGVQYHFASKDLLVTGLLDYLLSAFDLALEEVAAAFPEPGSWLNAYIELVLIQHSPVDQAFPALLASMTPGDTRAEVHQRFAAKWRRRAANDGIDPAIAEVVRLAADAFWLERSFGGETQAIQLSQTLRRLIECHKI